MGGGSRSASRGSGEPDYDAALARLEDVVLAVPISRALPPLEELAERAGLPPRFFEDDERARKVVGEALAGRPLGEPAEVSLRRVEVEMLILEVGVLHERIASGDRAAAMAAAERLREVRARVEDLSRIL